MSLKSKKMKNRNNKKNDKKIEKNFEKKIYYGTLLTIKPDVVK